MFRTPYADKILQARAAPNRRRAAMIETHVKLGNLVPMKSSGGGVVQFPYFFPCFSFLILPFMKQMKHDVPACCWSLLTKLVAKVYPMNSINKLMFFFFFFFFSYDANISRLFFIATSLIRFLFFLFFFLGYPAPVFA